MTLNEALTKQSFLSKILIKSEDGVLPKELKIKIMSARIQFSKIREEFDKDVKSIIEELKPEGFDDLQKKEAKTSDEELELTSMTNKINEEYALFVEEQGKKDVTAEFNISKDEYNDIVEVNAGNNIEINGNKLKAEDFLEVIYGLFVSE